MLDVRKLEAGGELNALVAERVMGWSVYGSVGDGSQEVYNQWLEHFRRRESNSLYLDKAGRLWRYTEKLTESRIDGIPQAEVWSPSTDIRDAFEVVAKIGTGLVLQVVPNEETLNCFRDDIALSQTTREAYSGTGLWISGFSGLPVVRATTAPLAISRAALKVVDHQSIIK